MERIQVPKQMELALLMDIVLEASKWRVSEGDERDPLRMEVEDRLSRRLPADKYDGVEVKGEVEIAVDTEKFKQQQKHARYAETHVRVMGPDGKKKWYPKEQCEKVKVGTGGTGWKWVLKKEVKYGTES